MSKSSIFINLSIAALGLTSLAVGHWTGYWLPGAAGALGGFCLLGLRSPISPPAPPTALGATTEVSSSAAVAPMEVRVSADPDLDPVDVLMQQERHALLLRPQIAMDLTAQQSEQAWRSLRESMALTSGGPVAVESWAATAGGLDGEPPSPLIATLDAFWIDRYPVTNSQFQRFVDAGGYEQLALWDEAVRPALQQFVDQTGRPGPKFWRDGEFDPQLSLHPVVGVNWHEANAYARWVGKRLPSDPEWLKTACWPVEDAGRPVQRRFPWGETLDPGNANLWSQRNTTSPIDAHPLGANPVGVVDLVGNVWEWMADEFGHWTQCGGEIESLEPMRGIRGAAFDTYFDRQASPQFSSGEPPLARRVNIGFRCVLSCQDIAESSEVDA